MKRFLAPLGIAVMALAAASLARAQNDAPTKPWRWHVSGGYSDPTGQTADVLQGGWLVDGGFTYTPHGAALGLRGDLNLASHNATRQFRAYGAALTGVRVDSGHGDFYSFSLGPSYSTPFVGRSRLYGFAQAGLYYTRLQLTQTVLFSGDYCDFFFGYCWRALVPGDLVVYDDSRTRLGWNVAVGVEFPTHYSFGPKWFVQAGYHRVETPQPLEYWPLTVGVRF